MDLNLEKYRHIPHGDMPGDKICIKESHIKKAERILPALEKEIARVKGNGKAKVVVTVCGGSGVGKSEIASLLAYMLTEKGQSCYVLSGDNYPHRIPCENDKKREEVYEKGGHEALVNYLGSQQEIDFKKVNHILKDFKNGKEKISLKRMGRKQGEQWYEDTDFSKVDILFLEWTHGNSEYLTEVDIPVLLNSTPEETLAHRKARNRDKGVDSPFVNMVLEIEQEMLKKQAYKAKIIVTKDGELITYREYKKIMER